MTVAAMSKPKQKETKDEEKPLNEANLEMLNLFANTALAFAQAGRKDIAQAMLNTLAPAPEGAPDRSGLTDEVQAWVEGVLFAEADTEIVETPAPADKS
jgi:hypothetical protein